MTVKTCAACAHVYKGPKEPTKDGWLPLPPREWLCTRPDRDSPLYLVTGTPPSSNTLCMQERSRICYSTQCGVDGRYFEST